MLSLQQLLAEVREDMMGQSPEPPPPPPPPPPPSPQLARPLWEEQAEMDRMLKLVMMDEAEVHKRHRGRDIVFDVVLGEAPDEAEARMHLLLDSPFAPGLC